MQAPVAIYRWFADGGAWAYDPLCARLLGPTPADELDLLFDRWLKSPAPGTVVVPHRGRSVWLLHTEREADSLDPRTRPGETFVLRAVLLPGPPNPKAIAKPESILRSITPERPGEDARLTADLPADLVPLRIGPGCLWGLLLLLPGRGL